MIKVVRVMKSPLLPMAIKQADGETRQVHIIAAEDDASVYVSAMMWDQLVAHFPEGPPGESFTLEVHRKT